VITREGDVFAAASLDPAARALPDRVGVKQQRHHHLRVERRPTPAVLPIASVESAQIELVNSVQHEPREVISRQPLAQARRQKQLLLSVTQKEVRGHRSPPVESEDAHRIVLASPDGKPRSKTGVCATASLRGFSTSGPCPIHHRCVTSGVPTGYQALISKPSLFV